MSLWSRFTNALRSRRLNSEIEEELRSHIEQAIEAGRDPVEARRALGSRIKIREASRDVKLIPWLDSLRADTIFGWRQIRKKKFISAAAVLSLALAIGACTAAFRLIDALLLRPLPITAPERLYVFVHQGIDFDGSFQTGDGCAYPMFRQMRAALKGRAEFIAVSYAAPVDLTYSSDAATEQAYLQYISGSMFPSFGLRPALGRLLTEDDDRKPGVRPVAVLSYDYWTRRFGQDSKIIGRAFHFGHAIYEIVGVVGRGFTGIEPAS